MAKKKRKHRKHHRKPTTHKKRVVHRKKRTVHRKRKATRKKRVSGFKHSRKHHTWGTVKRHTRKVSGHKKRKKRKSSGGGLPKWVLPAAAGFALGKFLLK